MILVNELRIGNLFHGFDNKVFSFEVSDFMCIWQDVNIDELIKEPISLTEEWVIKLGFESKDKAWFTKEKITLGFITKDECLQFELREFVIDIWFVHQLQNLYFALTGKELEYKLTPIIQ